MTAFLSPEEVETLTGYKRASDQHTWCANNDVHAWLNAKGECIVPRDLRSRSRGRPLEAGLPVVHIEQGW